LGAVQVGMLRALLEAGIKPDALVGCSVGAINAAAMAVDPGFAQLDRLESVWRNLRREDIFPSSKWHQAWHVARGRTHLHHPHALRSTIGRWLTITDLADTVVPVHVVTTELATATPRWWTSGSPVDVLAASCCLPGVFPPVSIGGTLHVDGGVVQNVPIGRAAQLGARRIVVLDATSWQASLEPPRSALGVFLHAARISRQAHLHHDLASLPRAVEVMWLSLEESPHLAYDDFTQTDRLVEAGYAATVARLAGRAVPRRRLRRSREQAPVVTPAQAIPSVAS
jgi:NTE family protein